MVPKRLRAWSRFLTKAKPVKPTVAKENAIGMPKVMSRKKAPRLIRPSIIGSNLSLFFHISEGMKHLNNQFEAKY